MKSVKRKLNASQSKELLSILRTRFIDHMHRHKGVVWESIETKLKANPEKLYALYRMEETGGEPDVVAYDKKKGTYTFFDCAAESPVGRRSTCYDQEGRQSRKEHAPEHTAIDMAESIGTHLLTEAEYRLLQKIEAFDLKTSSWIQTPPEIRALGGALFADRRYDHVFVYHNGAQSYYSARGFRSSLEV